MATDIADMPLVDAHAHIFQADMPVSRAAWNRPAYGYSAADYLADLDAHGVHFGIVAGISISGFYNDYMIEELRRHRRLRGTAIVHPGTDRYTLEKMAADGIVGIRFQLARQPLPDLDDDEHRLLLRRVVDLGWHVHVAVEADRLEPVLAALEPSGARIVLDHFAHPDPARAEGCFGLAVALRAVQRGNTWIKLSGDYRLHDLAYEGQALAPSGEALADRVAPLLLREAGPERLLWGSDSPFVAHERRTSFAAAIAALERWVPDAGQRREISRTALKLYFS